MKRWKEMHLRTQTRILPDHCCRYWNIASNGRAKSLKHFLDAAMAKKPWAIFVDSTILVNGYHIYSTACNYNSSVSNLCFACWDASQVFLVVANFPPFLRPVPPFWFTRACWRTCREEIALIQRQVTRHHIIAPPFATTPKSFRTSIVGKRFKVNIPGTEDLFVCVVPFPAPGLTDSIRSLGWQKPGNWPFPFRGRPWNPQKSCAMSGRCPGIHWSYNSHCSKRG